MTGKLELLFAKPIMIFNDLLNEDDYNYANTWLKEHFEKNAIEPKESKGGGPLYPEKGHGMQKTTVTVSTHAWDPELQNNVELETFNKLHECIQYDKTDYYTYENDIRIRIDKKIYLSKHSGSNISLLNPRRQPKE